MDDGDDGDAVNVDAENSDDDDDDDDDGVDVVWTAANNPALFGLSVSVLWMCVSLSDTHTHAGSHANAQKRAQTFKLKYILVCTCVD